MVVVVSGDFFYDSVGQFRHFIKRQGNAVSFPSRDPFQQWLETWDGSTRQVWRRIGIHREEKTKKGFPLVLIGLRQP